MEDKSYDLYNQRFEQAAKGAEKDFYEKIAGEERGHKLVLLDYYEYMKDRAGGMLKPNTRPWMAAAKYKMLVLSP